MTTRYHMIDKKRVAIICTTCTDDTGIVTKFYVCNSL